MRLRLGDIPVGALLCPGRISAAGAVPDACALCDLGSVSLGGPADLVLTVPGR